MQSTRYYLPLLKKIEEDSRVKQLFNTDLSHIQQYLFTKLKVEPTSKVKIKYSGLQLGREIADNDPKAPLTHRIKGRICISSSYRHSTYFDQFGLSGSMERARFGFLPLGIASRHSINRLIDSRNCFELIQRGFVIPNNNNKNNHEHIRTIEQIVSRDKGGMIISPQ